MKQTAKGMEFEVPGEVVDIRTKTQTRHYHNTTRVVVRIELVVVPAVGDIAEDTPAERIIRIVASQFGVSVRSLASRSRQKMHVWPRAVAQYLMRKHLKLSFGDIGSLFNRDHTTVMTAVLKVKRELLSNSAVQGAISDVERVLADLLEAE